MMILAFILLALNSASYYILGDDKYAIAIDIWMAAIFIMAYRK